MHWHKAECRYYFLPFFLKKKKNYRANNLKKNAYVRRTLFFSAMLHRR